MNDISNYSKINIIKLIIIIIVIIFSKINNFGSMEYIIFPKIYFYKNYSNQKIISKNIFCNFFCNYKFWKKYGIEDISQKLF